MDNIIFLDTETTGFKEPRMIQLAYKTNGVSFESMYNPTRPIDEGATKVHGITNEMVEDLQEFDGSESKGNLRMLLDKKILVAHNAIFDVKIIDIEGVEVSRVICTYKCCLNILNRANIKGNNKLQNLKEEFNLKVPENTKTHDAMGDVLVLEQLFLYILDKMEGTFEEKIERMIAVSN